MRAASAGVLLVSLWLPASALAWTPLRAENPSVNEGNQAMAEERYADALNDYDTAARELPESREVQLNRGLALLAQDLHEPAKEAFTSAADPPASGVTRGAAYYNLGIAWARQGDVLSEEENFEESSSHFREAAEAFKQSLRQEPGNRDAAWNLEYALQRIQEEEEKREEQQEENQEQEQSQDQEQSQEQEESQEQESEQDREQDEEQSQDQEQSQDPQKQQPDQEQEAREDETEEMPPAEVERFLDALEQNEESLPLQQARRRNAGRRPPEKDW